MIVWWLLRGTQVGVLRCGVFFFQAEDGIRDRVRSRGLGDVYKRQTPDMPCLAEQQQAPGAPMASGAKAPVRKGEAF